MIIFAYVHPSDLRSLKATVKARKEKPEGQQDIRIYMADKHAPGKMLNIQIRVVEGK
jgi:hypothetical protein